MSRVQAGLSEDWVPWPPSTLRCFCSWTSCCHRSGGHAFVSGAQRTEAASAIAVAVTPGLLLQLLLRSRGVHREPARIHAPAPQAGAASPSSPHGAGHGSWQHRFHLYCGEEQEED